MNTTHQFYTKLVQTNQTLLHHLEQVASHFPLEEAREPLQALLGVLDETIDLDRLYRLFTKNFQECDLSGEDFEGMNLSDFNFEKADLQMAQFRGAQLFQANLIEANLTGADLSETQARSIQMQRATARRSKLCDADLQGADLTGIDLSGSNLARCRLEDANLSESTCRYVTAQHVNLADARITDADWTGADLTGANMKRIQASCIQLISARLVQAQVFSALMDQANLSHAVCSFTDFRKVNFQEANLTRTIFHCANLQEVNLEGADLTGSACGEAQLGNRLRINAQTIIDRNNHALIGMALHLSAQTREQQQLALYVCFQQDLCWAEFTALLLWQNRDLVAWAKEVLMGIQSLQSEVKEHEELFQTLLQERQRLLNLSDVHEQLHHLMLSEMGQQEALSNPHLYWYLCGVLNMACQRPDMHITEEQKQTVLERLQPLINENKRDQ